MCSLSLRKAVLAAVIIWLRVSLPIGAQTLDQLIPQNVSLQHMTYKGRSAIQVLAARRAANGSSYAVLKGIRFQDGGIEVEVAGKPGAGAGPDARGFIGIAFRLRDNTYEYIYIRPTNGRAEDQVRRNHSTQYSSYPEFDFARLRRESPEKYESYVDLQPGEWTKFRIEVEGRKARLYIHNGEQPTLLVNDLKMEPHEGGIALWVGPGTEGYFCGLKITPESTRVLASSATADSKRIYFDTAHGEFPWPPQMEEIGKRVGYSLEAGRGLITPEALAGSQLVYLVHRIQHSRIRRSRPSSLL